MDQKTGNMLTIAFIVFVGLAIVMPSCNRDDRYEVNIQNINYAGEGLDLHAVGAIIKEVKSGEELEKRLNDSSNAINNLDLNEDGNVDYINVTEYGKGATRGFSLTTKLSGEVQEIATIEIEKVTDNNGEMEIMGNRQIYGSNHYYHSHFTLGDYLVLRYMWGPRWGMWHSPYYYGHYPSYYRPYRTVTTAAYQNRTQNYRNNTSFRREYTSRLQTPAVSPNTNKTASNIKAPLKNPSSTQRAFQQRNPSKQIKSGGFGRSSVRQSSTSRSGGLFGGK